MLRSLLVLGATARLRYAAKRTRGGDWASRLLARRPFKVAAVALANKMARIAWALLVQGGTYRMAAAIAAAARARRRTALAEGEGATRRR